MPNFERVRLAPKHASPQIIEVKKMHRFFFFDKFLSIFIIFYTIDQFIDLIQSRIIKLNELRTVLRFCSLEYFISILVSSSSFSSVGNEFVDLYK